MTDRACSPDPVRAAGPPAVTEGTPDGPIVLSHDPPLFKFMNIAPNLS